MKPINFRESMIKKCKVLDIAFRVQHHVNDQITPINTLQLYHITEPDHGIDLWVQVRNHLQDRFSLLH